MASCETGLRKVDHQELLVAEGQVTETSTVSDIELTKLAERALELAADVPEARFATFNSGL